jgi:hypothetical protein
MSPARYVDECLIVWAYVDESTLLLLARLASHRRASLPDVAGQLIAQALRHKPEPPPPGLVGSVEPMAEPTV